MMTVGWLASVARAADGAGHPIQDLIGTYQISGNVCDGGQPPDNTPVSIRVSGTLQITSFNPQSGRFSGFTNTDVISSTTGQTVASGLIQTIGGTESHLFHRISSSAVGFDLTPTRLLPWGSTQWTGFAFEPGGAGVTLAFVPPGYDFTNLEKNSVFDRCPKASSEIFPGGTIQDSPGIHGSRGPLTTCADGGSLHATVDERAGAAVTRESSGATTADAPPCPLSVTIAPNSGTTGMSDLDGVARFGIGGNCVSGCRMLTVSVSTVVPSVAPVDGATVSVNVTPIRAGIAPYPKGVDAGAGYLCDQAHPTRCAAGTLAGLTTDKHGQVHVLYWAPGIVPSITKAVGVGGESQQNAINTQQTTLTATADASICTSQCEREHGTSAPTGFAWSPHELYNQTATLSQNEGQALADWAAADSGLTPSDMVNGTGTPYRRFVDTYGQDVLEAAFTYLGVEYAAQGLELLGHAQDFKSLAVTDQVQQGFSALFLGQLKIDSHGLGQPPDGTKWVGFPQDVPIYPGKPWFEAITADGSYHVGISFGQSGLLYNLAHALEYRFRTVAGPLKLRLTVYEVSFCTTGVDCATIQPATLGSAIRTNRAGIGEYLYLRLQTAFQLTNTAIDDFGVVVPYNADGWMHWQKGLAITPS